MASKQAPITGSVLEWAIRDRLTSIGFVADSAEVTESELRAWIYEDDQPTETQLKRLAKTLRRPVSFFFLEQPPSHLPVAAEFRRFAGSSDRATQEALDAINLARRIQKTHAWIRLRLEENPIALPQLDVSADIEESGENLRKWLDWSTDNQTGKKATDASAAKVMRNRLQSKGIITLSLTLDEDITRGFSLHNEWAPLVAVNTRDAQPARLFSYAHELVHLCLGENAVCGTAGKKTGVERFCNRAGSALLMPRHAFLSFVSEQFRGSPVSTVRQVTRLKNHFRVSYRAAAIRAEQLNIASPGLYDRIDAIAKVDMKPRGGRAAPGQVRDRPAIRVDQYGHEFVSTLFEAERSGLLKRHQLTDLLRVSDKELSKVKQLSAAGANA
ncbi:ImmA/IrrE family metallo-endopeptidase [Nocardia sp. NPDC049737]|uniref:ImmA/IrrE family metallo-endopeptidase n=1 Tax=Nocardia sp. NPDC049737 TaxID=3154358 RepID=UPI003447B32D